MFEELYETLELIEFTPLKVKYWVRKLKNDKLYNIVNMLNTVILTESDDLINGNSLYNFYACKDLSGGPEYCANLPCRLKKISELINFACLYSDTVLIYNPFEEYLKYNLYNESVREYIYSDIQILWYLKPIINKGIIRFAKTNHHFCNECYKRFSSNKYYNYEEKVNGINDFLVKAFMENVNVYFENDDKYGFLEIGGPDYLIEHGKMYINFSTYTPNILKEFTDREKKYKLDEKTIKSSGIIDGLVGAIVKDFALQDWYTKNFDYSYLTNRILDTKLINLVNGNNSSEINSKIYDCITHQLPLICGAEIEDVLKIRQNDGESFELYRRNMRKLVRELPNNQNDAKLYFLMICSLNK
ncbi:MAG: hypothetical protein ABFD25_09455 [Clostridiaceae bacterium]